MTTPSDRAAHREPSGSPVGTDDSIVPALRRACAAADAERVGALLDGGADPDQLLDSIGTTPLMEVGAAGAEPTQVIDTVEVLLRAGATPTSIRLGRDVVDIVIADHESPIADPPTRSVVARRLLAAGARLDRRDDHGWSRLYTAAFADDVGAVAALLDLGADPDDDPAPLAAACWGTTSGPNGSARVIDLLVAAGAAIDQRDGAGWSLLHAAAMPYGHGSGFESSDGPNAAALCALLRHGADVDVLGPGGTTPLMLVAADGDLDSVEVLLSAGANPRLRAHDGRSAIDQARDAERLLAEVLDDAPANSTTGPEPMTAAALRQARLAACAARLAVS